MPKKIEFTELSDKARKTLLDARRGARVWDNNMDVQTAEEIMGYFEAFGPLNHHSTMILRDAKEYLEAQKGQSE